MILHLAMQKGWEIYSNMQYNVSTNIHISEIHPSHPQAIPNYKVGIPNIHRTKSKQDDYIIINQILQSHSF
jgi:hypothetical protein